MTGPRAVFAACAAALLGCASNEPQPRIEAVDPAQAYTDNDIRLMLTGAGFVPSFHLDPGQQPVELGSADRFRLGQPHSDLGHPGHPGPG
jgi:hypothetical protein